jgi:hypothetical protein
MPLMVWDPEAGRPRLSFEIDSLWGAVCLQFAEAVTGGLNYQRCPACSRWFELTPGVNRANRLTCSDSCRQRAFRQRRDRARELHAEGKTVREVARELGSVLKTVKGWVSKRKEG